MITDDDLDVAAEYIRQLLEALTTLEPVPHRSLYRRSPVTTVEKIDCPSLQPGTGIKCTHYWPHDGEPGQALDKAHRARIKRPGKPDDVAFWSDSDIETYHPETPLRARATDPIGSQMASRRQFGSKGQQAEILEALEESGRWMTCRELQSVLYGEGPYDEETAIKVNKLQSNAKKMWEAEQVLRFDRGPRLQYRAPDSSLCSQRHEFGLDGDYTLCGVCGLRGWRQER